MYQNHVGHQSGMAAIAVGKGMDGRQPVMETGGNLIRRV
jgi:hypothetical protein